ncbi:hypothetical protein A2899_02860 [Candidatus Amesbacteria bacterium RIFCSPLOWO2_01_FULL_49_25]|nr:MAG: hypothetical protein A2899_02860 [Candidatus Amesbacteria bacterium RIFCSPLOWO2_01_FULL_49_25]
MRILALEQLATKGIVLIERKGSKWHVQFIQKDENGFLLGRQSEWGTRLYRVIRDLLEKVTLAE